MNKKHQPNRLLQETSPYLLQHAYNPEEDGLAGAFCSFETPFG